MILNNCNLKAIKKQNCNEFKNCNGFCNKIEKYNILKISVLS